MYQVPDGLPTLSREAHPKGDGRACVMEYISVITGDVWTDRPECTDPLLTTAAISLNDVITDDAERSKVLVPFIGRLIGTSIKGSDARVMAYRHSLAQPVRRLNPEWFETRMRSQELCGCVQLPNSQCATEAEQRLHAATTRVLNSMVGKLGDTSQAVALYAEVLEQMLDIADEFLRRERRETDTKQKLVELIHDLVTV